MGVYSPATSTRTHTDTNRLPNSRAAPQQLVRSTPIPKETNPTMSFYDDDANGDDCCCCCCDEPCCATSCCCGDDCDCCGKPHAMGASQPANLHACRRADLALPRSARARERERKSEKRVPSFFQA